VRQSAAEEFTQLKDSDIRARRESIREEITRFTERLRSNGELGAAGPGTNPSEWINAQSRRDRLIVREYVATKILRQRAHGLPDDPSDFPELGGSDAPGYASHLVAVYRRHHESIDNFEGLYMKAAALAEEPDLNEKELNDRAEVWKGRTSNIKDRLRGRMDYPSRDVGAFIDALEHHPDVNANLISQ
jgi:hypothetical protein